MTTEQQADQLRDLLATHADAVRALLPGHLHHLAPFKVEQFGALTKYTLGEVRPGVWAMLHYLRAPDAGPLGPHSHPCRFDSHGIKGGYWERAFHEDGRTELVLRAAGGNHTIWPNTVHAIVGLPDGPAWTLVFGYEVIQEARHYPELAEAV
ncbi:MAG: hypothetical protein ACRYFZ_09435 [Janthinobacterium lividum]